MRRTPALAVALASPVALLGTEAFLAARRTYVDERDAPRVVATYGSGPPLKLLVLGDSTGAGLGVRTVDETVGGQLGRMLAAGTDPSGGRCVTLVGYAVSGARTTDLGPQVDAAVAAVPTGTPTVALVVVGANDAIKRERVSAVASALGSTVRRLRAAGVEVVVGTCPDLGGAVNFHPPLRQIVGWQGRRIAAVETKAVLAAGGTPVDLAGRTGPAFRANGALLSQDEFHPSAAGYLLWAQALLPEMKAAVRAAS